MGQKESPWGPQVLVDFSFHQTGVFKVPGIFDPDPVLLVLHTQEGVGVYLQSSGRPRADWRLLLAPLPGSLRTWLVGELLAGQGAGWTGLFFCPLVLLLLVFFVC